MTPNEMLKQLPPEDYGLIVRVIAALLTRAQTEDKQALEAQVRAESQRADRAERDMASLRTSHVRLARTIKKALGLEHWPRTTGGVAEVAERLVDRAIKKRKVFGGDDA